MLEGKHNVESVHVVYSTIGGPETKAAFILNIVDIGRVKLKEIFVSLV